MKIGKPLDLRQLSDMTEGFSGAEIEAVVREAIDEVFYARKQSNEGESSKKDLNMFDLQTAITGIVPLAKLMKDELADLDKWREGRTRQANYPDEIIGQSPERSVEA